MERSYSLYRLEYRLPLLWQLIYAADKLTPAGKATAEDPAGSGFLPQEAEALPAESNCTQWKSTSSYVTVYINHEDEKATMRTK